MTGGGRACHPPGVQYEDERSLGTRSTLQHPHKPRARHDERPIATHGLRGPAAVRAHSSNPAQQHPQSAVPASALAPTRATRRARGSPTTPSPWRARPCVHAFARGPADLTNRRRYHVSRGVPFQPGSRRAPLSLPRGAHARVEGGCMRLLTSAWHPTRRKDHHHYIIHTRYSCLAASQAPHSRNFPDLPKPGSLPAEP